MLPVAYAMGDDPVEYGFGVQPEPYAWADVQVDEKCVYLRPTGSPIVDVRECDSEAE